MQQSKFQRALWIALMITGWMSALQLFVQRVSSQSGVHDVSPSTAPSLQTGPYYALVIGNNNYKYLRHLLTPVSDANDVAQLLRERYGFQTQVLLDADRSHILTALVNYRKTLPANSNLLIYYAGHGYHDRDTDEAYWLPVDAQADNNVNWISADDITSNVKATPSSHVLIISDSCYSGYLVAGGFRTLEAEINPEDRHALLEKLLGSKSRNLMSSGGDEPVADTGAPGHSIFAAAILDSLRQIEYDSFAAGDLFDRFIQPRVGGRSDQLPQYSWIRNSGHISGDFVFSRQPILKESTAGATPTKLTGAEAAGPRSAPVTETGKDLVATDTAQRPPRIRGWAVGDDGTILHTEDAGSTWTQQDLGSTWAKQAGAPAAARLISVAFTTPQSGWAVASGVILHTANGGESWEYRKCCKGTYLSSVAFSTPQSGWAVGVMGTIVHTDDGGNHWKPQTSGTIQDLYCVAFATPQSGWVVGHSGTILHTEDGGKSWKEQASGSYDDLFSVAFATPQSGWAVGEHGIILHTEDGGNYWRPQSGGTSRLSLSSVAFVTPQLGWVVGSDGAILRTEDGGVSWKPQWSGTNAPLSSVAFATPKSGWAVGLSTILHTEDGGVSWKPQNSGMNALNSVFFLPPQ